MFWIIASILSLASCILFLGILKNYKLDHYFIKAKDISVGDTICYQGIEMKVTWVSIPDERQVVLIRTDKKAIKTFCYTTLTGVIK